MFFQQIQAWNSHSKLMETGMIVLAAFNVVTIIMMLIWCCCKFCPMTYEFSNESLASEDSESSGTPSPPAFDRNKKPSISILKNNTSRDDQMDEVINIDADPFVQAHSLLNGHQKPNEKRTRFDEPFLM